MIEYHEPGVVCCNSLTPCEKHEKKPAAQSDAPSAADLFTDEDIKCLEEIREESRGTRLHERIAQLESELADEKQAHKETTDEFHVAADGRDRWMERAGATESALSEARERAQALADWLEWKQRHSAERAQQCGEQGSDQLKTFNLGMVDCVQSVIQTDEYRQLRQLLAGASGAAGKGGAE